MMWTPDAVQKILLAIGLPGITIIGVCWAARHRGWPFPLNIRTKEK
jgi:hypothetical protein